MLLAWVLLVATGCTADIAIQDELQEQRKPGWLLHQVFPNPTGDNGFEDLLIAAEMLDRNQEWRALRKRESEDEATLADKPAAVASCKAVLARVRIGLAREKFQLRAGVSYDTPIPEYSHCRQLARLLVTELEVHFAHGREVQAIDSFRDACRLGQLLEQQALIAGVVGSVCQGIAVGALSRKLDQLDYNDCKYLRNVCTALLQQPSGLKDMMLGELSLAEDFLTRASLKGLASQLADFGPFQTTEEDSEEAIAEHRALFEAMQANPEVVEQEARHAAEFLRGYRAEVLGQLQKLPGSASFLSLRRTAWAGGLR